jgi:hypothetical protein
MKTFMFSQDRPFIPQFIQKILEFKSWVNGYLNDGPYILVGYTYMHLFHIVDKLFHVYVLWSPKDGSTIRL